MRTSILAALAVLIATPALAQDPGQIASVQRGASCPGCNLFQADLTGLEASGRNFSRARLRQSSMTAVVLNGANFSGADLRDADAYGGVFSSANFAGADLTNSTWVGTYLEGANFSGATLTGANFSGAQMGRARGLTQGQLNQACGDSTTELPGSLSIPSC